MAKRGPKKGSKWRWYYIRQANARRYYLGTRRSFGPRSKAPTWRLKEGFKRLCQLRRWYRQRGKPDTFVLEVKDDPQAKVNYPWRMPG